MAEIETLGSLIMHDTYYTASTVKFAHRDFRFSLGPFTEIWLCPQEEEFGMTWWVRWMVKGTGEVLESHYCAYPLAVASAVAIILDKARIKI